MVATTRGQHIWKIQYTQDPKRRYTLPPQYVVRRRVQFVLGGKYTRGSTVTKNFGAISNDDSTCTLESALEFV